MMQPATWLYIHGMKSALTCVLSAVMLLAGCSSGATTAVRTVTETLTPATPTVDDARLDETFLAQVSLVDAFNGESKKDLIDTAHATCVAFDRGDKMEALRVLNSSYGIEPAAKFMHAAVSVYCPEHLANATS